MGKRWRIVSVAAITCVLSLLVGLSACGSPKQGDAETQGTEAKSSTALMGQSGELDENGFPKPAVRTLEGGIQKPLERLGVTDLRRGLSGNA